MSILAINFGSSSLKASLFSDKADRRNFHYEYDCEDNHKDKAFKQLLKELNGEKPSVVGHRFVHGGDVSDAAREVDEAERARLDSLIHLAPLHMPSNLLGLDLCKKSFNVPQVACFDNAFHDTMPEIAKCLPIPQELDLHRFGFHGLNYAYVAKVLPHIIANAAYQKVIVAHLGSGTSLCLMENLESVETTMGYTPAGGIPMATRSGDLDPGVILELASRFNTQQLSNLVFHKMGLLALSNGESADIKTLLSSNTEEAKFAVDYFCRQVRGAIGALAGKVGGVDALVFTAGIGENSAVIREKICTPLNFLGFVLDAEANRSAATKIGKRGYKPIVIIPADEEIIIRDLSLSLTT